MKKTTTSDGLKGRFDQAKIDATTEADIERHARADGDEWTPEMLTRVHTVDLGKKDIHIRIDAEVLDFFQREGRGYQSRINAVLRTYVEAHRKVG